MKINKEDLEDKIEKVIKILGNMDGSDIDFINYQYILNHHSEKYNKLYGEYKDSSKD